MRAKSRLGPVVRLQNTTTTTTLRKVSGAPLVIDDPLSEPKEQFLGFYIADCDTLDDAIAFASGQGQSRDRRRGL